ncbi:MAG TPA: DUF3078 domain-containing protein [Bacteroidales bacterium]|nr:DUF3078 domain-containing protein [Bacteroidales bacterium]
MKKRTILSILLLLVFHPIVFSQVTDAESKLRTIVTDTIPGWKKGGILGLSLAQTSLTNWASGGQNSLAINGLISVFANYKKDNIAWDNSLDVGYGLLKQGKNSDYMKTDDKFDFMSKFGKKATKNFFYTALLNVRTQMTVGKDYAKDTSKISNFLAPLYVIGALGMDYKPNSYFGAFIAPLTGKITWVNDQELANAGAFGVQGAKYDNLGAILELGKKSKSEFGGYVRIIYSRNDFKNELLKNVSFTTKADLFSNYLHNPQFVDVSWETQVALQVNKYIRVNVNTHLIWDKDILIPIDTNNDGTMDDSKALVQFKEILGVGLSYKF